MASIGCALILTMGIGVNAVLNVMIPLLIEGMNTTLTGVAVGPMLGTISAFLFSLIGTKLLAKLTPKYGLLVGTFCAVLTLVFTAMATNVFVFYVGCVINGAVLAIGAHAAVAGVIAAWYREKTAAVVGLVVGVSSLLIAALVFASGQMLAVMTYRAVIYILAATSLIVGVLANILLVGKVPSMAAAAASAPASQADTTEAAESAEAPAAPAPVQPEIPGLTLKQALGTASFYIFFVAMFLAAFPMNGFSTFATTFFVMNGLDTTAAATYLSVYAAITAIVTMGAGYVVTKLGSRVLAPIVFVGFAGGVACLVYWAVNGQTLLIWLGLILASTIAPVIVLPSLMIPEFFGMKDYTSINAAGMAAFFIGAAIMMVTIAAIAETAGISTAFIILAVLGIVALALFFLVLATSPMKRFLKQVAVQEA